MILLLKIKNVDFERERERHSVDRKTKSKTFYEYIR